MIQIFLALGGCVFRGSTRDPHGPKNDKKMMANSAQTTENEGNFCKYDGKRKKWQKCSRSNKHISPLEYWMPVFVRGGDSYPKNEDLNYGEFSRLECSAAALFI